MCGVKMCFERSIFFLKFCTSETMYIKVYKTIQIMPDVHMCIFRKMPEQYKYL